MPELPEVETVRRGLAPVLTGRVIARAEVRRADLRWPFPPDLACRLTGRRVLRLWRRSKYLMADLDDGATLLIHLGMSGRITVSGAAVGAFHHLHGESAKHDHVVLHTDNGACITFNDPRRFGALDLVETASAERQWLLAKIGPEPLGDAFDAAYLVRTLRQRRSPVKAVLLDQRVVAGLGNIYVCEILHRTGIAPWRPANRIAAGRVRDIVPAVRAVLCEAIEAGGSTLRDHRQTDGALGYFQHGFRVYGRAGKACVAPGCTGTVRRIVQSGRSSFYCPACQR